MKLRWQLALGEDGGEIDVDDEHPIVVLFQRKDIEKVVVVLKDGRKVEYERV